MAQKTVRELFNIPSDKVIIIPDAQPSAGAVANPHYVFTRDIVRDLMVFWALGLRAMMLIGHKGTGKTSVIEQFHERMRVNLHVATGSADTTLEHLFGQYVLTPSGSLEWKDGPVSLAARFGESVLINEFNTLPYAIQSSLMDACHTGSRLTIPGLNESIQPMEGFRVYGTMNPKGGLSGQYRGRNELDAAFRERFFHVQVGYPSQDEEIEIVTAAWVATMRDSSKTAQFRELASKQVEVAHRVRALANSARADCLPEVISTRTLCTWAKVWAAYNNFREVNAVHASLQRALTNGSDHAASFVIHQIVQEVMGVNSPVKMT